MYNFQKIIQFNQELKVTQLFKSEMIFLHRDKKVLMYFPSLFGHFSCQKIKTMKWIVVALPVPCIQLNGKS